MNAGKFAGESPTTEEHLANFLNLEKNPVLFLTVSSEFVERQKLHGIRHSKKVYNGFEKQFVLANYKRICIAN